MPHNPYRGYKFDADYGTNAPSFGDDLSRKQELFELLAKRVWEYDEILAAKLLEIKETLQKYSDILDGKVEDFDNIILEKTQKWLDENMEHIMTQAVQLVWFGLTDDGYFMAVSPSNWSDIQFDTNNDGQLMLIY